MFEVGYFPPGGGKNLPLFCFLENYPTFPPGKNYRSHFLYIREEERIWLACYSAALRSRTKTTYVIDEEKPAEPPYEWCTAIRNIKIIPKWKTYRKCIFVKYLTPKLAKSIIRDAHWLNAQVSGFVGKWPAQIISGKAQTCQTCEIEYSRGDSACQFVVMKW